jgi:hypothetical protein
VAQLGADELIGTFANEDAKENTNCSSGTQNYLNCSLSVAVVHDQSGSLNLPDRTLNYEIPHFSYPFFTGPEPGGIIISPVARACGWQGAKFCRGGQRKAQKRRLNPTPSHSTAWPREDGDSD